ncbi:MAG: hypothetical protein Tsb0021_16480 [Chlamydiales bacterium]
MLSKHKLIMETELVKDYYSSIQKCAQDILRGKRRMIHLFRILKLYQKKCHHPFFFEAEFAFFQGEYELALDYYLKSKDIPFFNFFCFRAAAYVYYHLGKPEKSLELCRKGLSLREKDPFLKSLLFVLVRHSPISEVQLQRFRLTPLNETNEETFLNKVKARQELYQIFKEYSDATQCV